jgi:hypothetical protein
VAYSAVAQLTNLARQRLAQALATGKSFVVDRFVVGSGGHDVLDPTIALTPDPTAVICPLTTFGPKLVTSATLVSPFCPQFVCDLAGDEAVGPISDICLLGTIIYSPIPNDPELNTQFLFAQANTPLRVKLDDEVLSFDVSISF